MVYVEGSFEDFGTEEEFKERIRKYRSNGYDFSRDKGSLYKIKLNGKTVGIADEVYDSDEPFLISFVNHERPDLLTSSL